MTNEFSKGYIHVETLLGDRLLSAQLSGGLTKESITSAFQCNGLFSFKGNKIRWKMNESTLRYPNLEEPSKEKKRKVEQDTSSPTSMLVEEDRDNCQENLSEYLEWISRIEKVFQYIYSAVDYSTHYENIYIPFYPQTEKKDFEGTKLNFNDFNPPQDLLDHESFQELAKLNHQYEQLKNWNEQCPQLHDVDRFCNKNMNFLIQFLFAEMFDFAEEFEITLLAKIGGIPKDVFEEKFLHINHYPLEDYLYIMAQKFLRFQR